MFTQWPAPLPSGTVCEEAVLAFDQNRQHRLLITLPLFEEHNKFRRQAVEAMRRLDFMGIDSFLPDLPGCNESCAAVKDQTVGGWLAAVAQAGSHFGATHALAIRSGALVQPATLPTFAYAPQQGGQLLRAMIRARTVASREAGLEEKSEHIAASGRENGVELAGWHLGAAMVRELETAEYTPAPEDRVIEHSDIGGPPLWLRAEPGEDPQQADALAAILAASLLGPA